MSLEPQGESCQLAWVDFDLEDILAGTFGRIIRQAFLFATAVWTGCMLGGLALVIGICGYSWHEALEWLPKLWMSPLLLFSLWLLANLPVLLCGLVYFIISEDAGFTAWGVLVALESFFVMAAGSSRLHSNGPIAVAWISWLILLGILETCVWLIHRRLEKRWARELAILKLENARRRAELKAEESEPSKPGSI